MKFGKMLVFAEAMDAADALAAPNTAIDNTGSIGNDKRKKKKGEDDDDVELSEARRVLRPGEFKLTKAEWKQWRRYKAPIANLNPDSKDDVGAVYREAWDAGGGANGTDFIVVFYPRSYKIIPVLKLSTQTNNIWYTLKSTGTTYSEYRKDQTYMDDSELYGKDVVTRSKPNKYH